MKLTQIATEKIIHRLFAGEDYRAEILTLIDTIFLQHAIEFFKQIIEAKLYGENITGDWYEKYFLNPQLDKAEFGVNAGLNIKSIENSYGTSRKDVVVEVSLEHYNDLKVIIEELIEAGENLEINLTIKFNGVGINLTLSETLIVINALAVKRAQIRGGAWSTAGKQTELPFMVTLAKLYQVPPSNYKLKGLTDENREVDFHFVDDAGQRYYCEFKLMGQGNPESADVAIARQTDIFIAYKLSETNKKQLEGLGTYWVELHSKTGFRKIKVILDELGIQCTDFEGVVESLLDQLIQEAFDEIINF